VERPELEFLKRLWGLGTEEEEGYRTGPPGYIDWRNSFLGIDSGAHTRLKIPALSRNGRVTEPKRQSESIKARLTEPKE
jgi:hypothetical protein